MERLPRLRPNDELNSCPSIESSGNSITTDLDIKQYCRAIDLPGFEDNISEGDYEFKLNKIKLMLSRQPNESSNSALCHRCRVGI